MNRISPIVFAAYILMSFSGNGRTAEIHVPASASSIQSAIDLAQDGDTVVVAPGRYLENINFHGKAITLRSENPEDPKILAGTVIDGGASGPCVTFTSMAGGTAILAGFTLTNGHASNGGGICCENSWAIITRVSIQLNSGLQFGGGIYAIASSVEISDSDVINNEANAGGGLYCEESSLVVERNAVSSNEATAGAGMYLSHCSGGIAHNALTSNVRAFMGGGMCTYGSTLRIASNVLTANSADHGGGLFCQSSYQDIEGNTIMANASYVGAGINIDGQSHRLVGNIITGNAAQQAGGGVAIHNHGSAVLCANTIVGNFVRYGRGGGVQLSDSTSCSLVDCIIRGNIAPYGPQLSLGYSSDEPSLAVSNCDIAGGEKGLPVGPSGTLIWGPGNIDADPLFVDPGHWDEKGTPSNLSDDVFIPGDYHLLPGSPCIDAGTNRIDNPDTPAIETLPDKDIAGNPRIIDGDLDGVATVDMGAYEFLPGDANYDGKVNVIDLILIRNNLNKDPASVPAARRADLNNDGRVDILDLIFARGQIPRN